MSPTARSAEQRRRLEERSRAWRRARAIEVPRTADVCVIGGGASGLTAAIAAARAGARVVVLEAGPEMGRPILATGNGRCNLANRDLSPAHYNDPAFVGAVMGSHPVEAIRGLFGGLGLAIVEEEERLYPRSQQAASVRNLLVGELERLGSVSAPLREVETVAPPSGAGRASWHVAYRDLCLEPRTGTPTAPGMRDIACASVVAATGGGPCAPLAALALPRTALRPGLCGLSCEPSPLDALDGRRALGLVRLVRDGETVALAEGEVLFRTAGITGPPILDFSRVSQPGDAVFADLVPELSTDAILRALEPSLDHAGIPGEHALDGLLDPVIGRVLIDCAREGWPIPADSVAESAASLAKALPFRVGGPAAAHAQITLGGIATRCIDPATMAVTSDAEGRKLVSGLYATGEALDVDGPCGGYNLAFAWLSGLKAGAAAAASAAEGGEAAGASGASGASGPRARGEGRP